MLHAYRVGVPQRQVMPEACKGKAPEASYETPRRQTATCVPTSTTRSVGIWK
jgi:hypothetical protein